MFVLMFLLSTPFFRTCWVSESNTSTEQFGTVLLVSLIIQHICEDCSSKISFEAGKCLPQAFRRPLYWFPKYLNNFSFICFHKSLIIYTHQQDHRIYCLSSMQSHQNFCAIESRLIPRMSEEAPSLRRPTCHILADLWIGHHSFMRSLYEIYTACMSLGWAPLCGALGARSTL